MTNPVKRLVGSVVMKARCLITTIRKELRPLRRGKSFRRGVLKKERKQ